MGLAADNTEVDGLPTPGTLEHRFDDDDATDNDNAADNDNHDDNSDYDNNDDLLNDERAVMMIIDGLLIYQAPISALKS